MDSKPKRYLLSGCAMLGLVFGVDRARGAEAQPSSQSHRHCVRLVDHLAGEQARYEPLDRKVVFDLSIKREQIEAFRARGGHEFLRDTFFLLPHNDGESVRAADILKAVHAPYFQSDNVVWGTKLDHMIPSSSYFRDYFLRRYPREAIKRIVLFELPAPNLEASLRKAGFEVIIIDHHDYAELHTSRYNALSSLEQFMALIGWTASRADLAIATNDRSYISGLRAMGLTDDEIRYVRKNDHYGQGKSRLRVEVEFERVNRHIHSIKEIYGFKVIGSISKIVDTAILKEELNLRSPSGIVDIFEFTEKRIGFSGSPDVIKALKEKIDYAKLGYGAGDVVVYGGGDENASMFFGFKPKFPPLDENDLIPLPVVLEFLEVARQAKTIEIERSIEWHL